MTVTKTIAALTPLDAGALVLSEDRRFWAHGGVDWQGGRSRPKVYNHGRYRFSPYFGNLDRPTERNVFHGSHATLAGFWQQHGLRLR